MNLRSQWRKQVQLPNLLILLNFIAEPASFMTPTRLSQEAKRIANAGGLSCTVMNADQVEKLGMGSFLGVAKGAKEPPKFIVLKYSADKTHKTVAIVGNEYFDSGGLSLKNATSMEHMKYDMSGAAVVIALQAISNAAACSKCGGYSCSH